MYPIESKFSNIKLHLTNLFKTHPPPFTDSFHCQVFDFYTICHIMNKAFLKPLKPSGPLKVKVEPIFRYLSPKLTPPHFIAKFFWPNNFYYKDK